MIKRNYNIIIYLLLICSISFSVYLYNKNSIQKDNIEYLNHNLQVKDTKIENITFSLKEMKSFLKNKDTNQKKEIDSIIKLNKIKINNLINYQKISVVQKSVDTSKVVFNKLIIKNDSMYKKDFKVVKKCLKIEGYLLSKDSSSNIFITSTESDNRIYITKSYIKTFWDKVFFRKGKEKLNVNSDCGEIIFNEIKIK